MPKHLYSIPPSILPQLIHQLKQGTTYHAIDRSVQKDSLTGSWATKIGTTILKKGGKVKTGSGNPLSTQAERSTYLFLLQNLIKVYSRLSLSGGHHTIYVDNKQVLDSSTLSQPASGPSKFLLDNFDILESIQNFTDRLTHQYEAKLTLKHIYSHLDNPHKRAKISHTHGIEVLNSHLRNKIGRQLNKVCDTEATNHHQNMTFLPYPIPPHQPQQNFQNTTHTTKNLHYLQDLYQQTKYENYLMAKFNWNREIFNSIDWKIIEQYITSLPLTKKVQYVKFLHKWHSTQKKLLRTNPERCSSPECILCGFPEDNDDHIFHCTHPIMREA